MIPDATIHEPEPLEAEWDGLVVEPDPMGDLVEVEPNPEVLELIAFVPEDPQPLPPPRRSRYAIAAGMAGVVLSLLLHLWIAQLAAHTYITVGGRDARDRSADRAEDDDRPTPTLEIAKPIEELTFGQENGTIPATAWLGHDDPRELRAPQSSVEQPALQQKEDPVEQGPVALDPTPPALNTRRTEETPAAPPSPAEARLAAAPPALVTPPPPPPVRLPDLAARPEFDFRDIQIAPQEQPGLAVEQQEDTSPQQEPTPPTRVELTVESPPQTEPAPPAVPAPASVARPTASARSDRESMPTTTLPGQLEVRPGRVAAAEGIEIKTVHPRFSAIARASAMPVNPVAILTFDRTGAVVDVRLVKSSGFENVDGPIVASLYKWRASGRRIAELTGHLEVEIRILLVRE